MKAATTQGFVLNSRIVTVEADVPDIGDDDVLVEVHASSVNPKDWKLNQTISSIISPFAFIARPLLLGDDLAGIVVDKGKDVSDFDIGDAVFGMDMNFRTAACAEFACIRSTCIAKKPASISFEQAAASPLVGLTALQGLQIGKVGCGSKVLIIGASGGVGTFAVQIAYAMGAIVTGVCSAGNAALVTSLGAEQVIDYSVEDISKRQDDFDMVFDVSSKHSLATCSKLLRDGGIFVSTGGYATAIARSYRDRLLHSNKHSKNVWVDANTTDLELLANYLEEGLVKPVIDSEFSLDQIDAAFQRSRTGRCVGKVVVRVKDQ